MPIGFTFFTRILPCSPLLPCQISISSQENDPRIMLSFLLPTRINSQLYFYFKALTIAFV